MRCLVEQGQARTGIERQPGSLLMLAGTTHAALTRPGPGDVAALSFHSGSLCVFFLQLRAGDNQSIRQIISRIEEGLVLVFD